MRRRWKIIVGALATLFIGWGVFGGSWYADRTIVAETTFQQGRQAAEDHHYLLAEERLTSAMRKYPAGSIGQRRAQNWRAHVRIQLWKFEEAIDDANQELQIWPENGIALSNRGEASYKLRRYEEAQADFDHALKAGSSYGATRYFRALIAERQGDLDTAHSLLSSVVQDYECCYDYIARGFAALARIARAKGDTAAEATYISSARERDPSVLLEIE